MAILPANYVRKNNATVNDNLSNESVRDTLIFSFSFSKNKKSEVRVRITKKKWKCSRPLKEESCNDAWLVI